MYLISGKDDDITPSDQVFNAEKRLGSRSADIVKKRIGGGHIGLFMGSKQLREEWPKIARWIMEKTEKKDE